MIFWSPINVVWESIWCLAGVLCKSKTRLPKEKLVGYQKVCIGTSHGNLMEFLGTYIEVQPVFSRSLCAVRGVYGFYLKKHNIISLDEKCKTITYGV